MSFPTACRGTNRSADTCANRNACLGAGPAAGSGGGALRRERMYEFLEKLIRVSLPRIRDFKGIESKFDGRGNYTLGITEQIIFPEINIDQVDRIQGMNITFVTSAKTDEEGYALLKGFGLPFKNAKND